MTRATESSVHSKRQAPSICQMVHYVSYGTPGGEHTSECRSAVITEVASHRDAPAGRVGLCVLNPTGIFFRSLADGGSDYSDVIPNTAMYPGGTWHWPERVE